LAVVAADSVARLAMVQVNLVDLVAALLQIVLVAALLGNRVVLGPLVKVIEAETEILHMIR
jgi:hypothetical protein